MNKHSPKKLSTDINLPNKYRHVIIKRPNGVITVCRSTYLPQDTLNKLGANKENINVLDSSKVDCINVDVDHTQHLIQNRNKKKQNAHVQQKSARAAQLNKSFLT